MVYFFTAAYVDADRLPLVTSCIIQVDQDVNEPWPLEIYSHDGKAYNVTLEPGEMALYESHTTLHGRPVPLNGKFFVSSQSTMIFIS